MSTETTVRNTDVYYQVSFRGVADAHGKYLALRQCIIDGCAAMKVKSPALSSEAEDVQHWASMPGGFVKAHMPWEIVVPRSLYRAFIHAIRCDDSVNGNACYTAVRRYGSWV